MPTQRLDAQPVLPKLVTASVRDGASPRDAESCMLKSINTALVWAGVRPAARLDSSPDGPAFRRAVQSIAKASGRPLRMVRWGRSDTEPLVIDAQRCRPQDVEAIVHADSDLTPSVSAAMGRLLGYRCLYRDSADAKAWKSAGVMTLYADVQRADAESMKSDMRAGLVSLWLAGFGCSRQDMDDQQMARMLRRMIKEWGQASSRTLAGSIVHVQDVAWFVVVFRVVFERT